MLKLIGIRVRARLIAIWEIDPTQTRLTLLHESVSPPSLWSATRTSRPLKNIRNDKSAFFWLSYKVEIIASREMPLCWATDRKIELNVRCEGSHDPEPRSADGRV